MKSHPELRASSSSHCSLALNRGDVPEHFINRDRLIAPHRVVVCFFLCLFLLLPLAGNFNLKTTLFTYFCVAELFIGLTTIHSLSSSVATAPDGDGLAGSLHFQLLRHFVCGWFFLIALHESTTYDGCPQIGYIITRLPNSSCPNPDTAAVHFYSHCLTQFSKLFLRQGGKNRHRTLGHCLAQSPAARAFGSPCDTQISKSNSC